MLTPAARLARRLVSAPPLVPVPCRICGAPAMLPPGGGTRYAVCGSRDCFDEAVAAVTI
jgi:hypothetical protein